MSLVTVNLILLLMNLDTTLLTCIAGKHRVNRHDMCVLELEKMIRHAGLFTEREERGVFHHLIMILKTVLI
jgi:hypothetical protein